MVVRDTSPWPLSCHAHEMAAFLALPFLAFPAHAGTVTAIRTSQVTKSLCIQVKTANVGGSGQPTLANIEANLALLNPNGIGTGISCVRDDVVNGNSVSLNALGALGYKLDLYIGYNPASSNSGYSAITSLLGYQTSGYLAAVEGLDESGRCAIHRVRGAVYVQLFVGISGITYTGSSTSPNWQVAVAAEQDLGMPLAVVFPVYLPYDHCSDEWRVWSPRRCRSHRTGHVDRRSDEQRQRAILPYRWELADCHCANCGYQLH